MKQSLISRGIWVGMAIVLAITIFVNYKTAYKGNVEKIRFNSGDIEIRGVIVRPKTEGPHPGIVLLHGAGGSHQGYGKWYFRFHTNAFVKRGFAVMTYTKRGSGRNKVNYDLVSMQHLADDALQAISELRRRDYVDGNRVGIMSVSESGWFTPELAVRDGNIAFLVNRVAPPLSYMQTTLYEAKVEALEDGFSEVETDEIIIPLIRRIRRYYIDVSRDSIRFDGPQRDSINAELQRLESHERFNGYFRSSLSAYDAGRYAASAYDFAYDPAPFLEETKAPMLYVFGGTDVNVPTEASVEYLENLKAVTGKYITIQVYPETGHYMYANPRLPIEGMYVKGYLDLIADWAAQQVN